MPDFVIYHPAQNTENASLPGVPLANMTEAEFNALPLWLKVSLCGCPFYTVPQSACDAARLALNPPQEDQPAEPTPVVNGKDEGNNDV